MHIIWLDFLWRPEKGIRFPVVRGTNSIEPLGVGAGNTGRATNDLNQRAISSNTPPTHTHLINLLSV